MAKLKIGYQNLLESASTITVTDSTTGFEKALAYNWRTFDGWKASSTGTVYYTADLGSAMSVDYWGAAAHTLGTNGGSIKLQYSSDNFVADTNDFASAVSPTDDTCMFQTVSTAISARYWRWEITSTPVSFFGVLSLGIALTAARSVSSGFSLPHEARMNEVINQTSEGGAFLGKSVIRRGISGSLNFDIQTLTYARGTWSTFLDHAETKPFFLSWNPDYNDTVYAWMEGDPMDVKFDKPNTLSFGIKYKGLK